MHSHPNLVHMLAFLLQDQQASFAEVLDLPTAEYNMGRANVTFEPSPSPLPARLATPTPPPPPGCKGKQSSSRACAAQDPKAKSPDTSAKAKVPNSKDQLKMVQTIITNCPDLSLHGVINLITPQLSKSQGPPSSGVSVFTPSPPRNQLQTAKPYTWQQKQSRKDIVNKPSFRGTNAQEMHLTVPQDGPFAPLLGTSGMALKNGLKMQLSGIISQAQAALFEVNLLVAVRWSTKDNLIASMVRFPLT